MFNKIHNLSLKHIIAFWLVATPLLFVVILLAEAQARPQVFVSWRAESYAPPAYGGKILPTAGSLITISFEVVDDGKLANLSKQTIYWYLNNDLIENRDGVQSVAFNAPARAPSILELRIELPAYPSGLLLKTINIPVVRPEAAIEAPYPDGQFSETRVQMAGSPYFFNANKINDFRFSWTINGEAAEGEESSREFIVNLNPDAPPGSTLNIGLTINNTSFTEEVASVFAKLTRRE